MNSRSRFPSVFLLLFSSQTIEASSQHNSSFLLLLLAVWDDVTQRSVIQVSCCVDIWRLKLLLHLKRHMFVENVIYLKFNIVKWWNLLIFSDSTQHDVIRNLLDLLRWKLVGLCHVIRICNLITWHRTSLSLCLTAEKTFVSNRHSLVFVNEILIHCFYFLN